MNLIYGGVRIPRHAVWSRMHCERVLNNGVISPVCRCINGQSEKHDTMLFLSTQYMISRHLPNPNQTSTDRDSDVLQI